MDEKDYQYIRSNTNEDVDLSIELIVYNHSSYIHQAMDSILMQKTEYSYKIIVGEDCSTDNSREILLEYYRKYPDKIELILWNHNVGVEINSVEITKKCKGKYIAYIEGDDYWTDPFKVQKQISFLETNKQYIGTAHNVRCVDNKGNFLHRNPGIYSYKEDHIYGADEVGRMELVGQTASVINRNLWKNFNETDWKNYSKCNANGDLKESIMWGSKGDIYFFHDIMANHRRVFVGDSWTAQMEGKNMLWIEYQMRFEIKKFMLEEFKIDVGPNWHNLVEMYYKESIIQMLYRPCRENLKIMLKLYLEKRKMRENDALGESGY